MPNGRLARAVLNGQDACELYVNDSGSAASVTLFSNSISTNTNAKITTVVGVAATAFNLTSTIFDIGANGVGIGTTITNNLCCFAGWNYCNPYQCDAAKQLTQGMTTGFYRSQLCGPGLGFTYTNQTTGESGGGINCGYTCNDYIGLGKSTRTPWAYMEYVSIAGSMTSSLCQQLCGDNTAHAPTRFGYPYASICMNGVCIGSCCNPGSDLLCRCDCWVKAPYGGTTMHSLTLGFCRTCIYDGCDCNGSPNYNSLACNYCSRGDSRFTHMVGVLPGWCNYVYPWSGHCCGRNRMKDFYVITACNIDTSNYDLGARFTVNPLPCCCLGQTYCGGTCPHGHCGCDPNVGYVPYCGVCCCCCSTRGHGPKRCMQQWQLRGGAAQPECSWWCTCMYDVGAWANWWALDPSNYCNFCEHHCIDENGDFYTWRRCGDIGASGNWQQCCGWIYQPTEWGCGQKFRCEGHQEVTGGAGMFAMHWSRCCTINRTFIMCICCGQGSECGLACRNGCSFDMSQMRTCSLDYWSARFCWSHCCCAIACNTCIINHGAKTPGSLPMSPYGVACAVSCGMFIAQIQNQCTATSFQIGFPHTLSFYCCLSGQRCMTIINLVVGTGYCMNGGNLVGDSNNCKNSDKFPDYATAEAASCVGGESQLKYFAYNPRKCCHYGLFRTGIASAAALPTACSCAALNGVNPTCGVFSFNAKRIEKTQGTSKDGNAARTTFECGQICQNIWCAGLCYDAAVCVWAADSAVNRAGIVTTMWCKVANFPSDWLCEYYVTPRMCVSCLYRYSFSEWTISVYNCNTCAWDPWTSKDLITWDKSPFNQTVCADPIHTCCLCIAQAKVISTQDVFMKCMDCSGLIDLCVDMNQYERTGIVLSDGDRLTIKNHSSTQPISVQVWGYEG